MKRTASCPCAMRLPGAERKPSRDRDHYVDDGSRDRHAGAAHPYGSAGPRVRMISFTRISAQAALMAGLETARGDAIVTMDCDLQHPRPCCANGRSLAEGLQGRSAVREETRDAGPGKRLTSRAFYRLMQALSDTPITPGAADPVGWTRSGALRDLLSLSDSRLFSARDGVMDRPITGSPSPLCGECAAAWRPQLYMANRCFRLLSTQSPHSRPGLCGSRSKWALCSSLRCFYILALHRG